TAKLPTAFRPQRLDFLYHMFSNCSHAIRDRKMDEKIPENCRVMTDNEVANELRMALQIGAARAKSGRMTVNEMVHQFGLQLLAKEVTEILSHYMVFLKKPPREPHSTPAGHREQNPR